MAIAKALESNGREVFYNSFDQPLNTELANLIELPSFSLSIEQSAKEYIAKKLGSETIAGWILKTPFFSSLFNMLPGLGHMILLGHLIDKLESNPNLTIVLDSPSSGHALTMFESPGNFKEMFRTGLIVDDIQRMEKFLYEPGAMEVIVCSLPTKMAIQEAIDLETKLKERQVPQTKLVVNDLLSFSKPILEANEKDLPEFIIKKIAGEKEAQESSKQTPYLNIPHFPESKPSQIISACAQFLKGAAK